MRVLHIFDHSVPYFSGYTFRSGYILSNQRKLGFEPFVLTTMKHQKQNGLCETIDGQAFFRTPAFENPITLRAFRTPMLGEAMHMHRLYHRILEVCRQQPVDLIHAHSPALNGLPALKVARYLGLPMVYEIRAFWEDAGVDLGTYSSENSLKYKSVRRFETYLCHRADSVTTICEGLKNDLLSRNVDPKKITVIPNGVEAGRFLPLPRDEALMASLHLEPGKVIGFIGSFYDYEGLDLLLKAFALVLKQRKDLKLLMVGGGYQGQDERLKMLSHSLNLGDRCVFTGRVPHDQVDHYYSVIDVLAYPRHSMRLTELVTPLKPLEAMSMEKIVIGSRVGGIAELVKEGENGFLFDPDSAESLADTLLRIMNHPQETVEMGARARRFIETHRNWEKIVKRYEHVYSHAEESNRRR
ncbi:MAG: TIGR04063 family PEP-CTERM/XrtA system glycosyltransferase [Planctomycetota bacterium]